MEFKKAPGSQINAPFKENLESYAMILGMRSGNLDYPQHSTKSGGGNGGALFF